MTNIHTVFLFHAHDTTAYSNPKLTQYNFSTNFIPVLAAGIIAIHTALPVIDVHDDAPYAVEAAAIAKIVRSLVADGVITLCEGERASEDGNSEGRPDTKTFIDDIPIPSHNSQSMLDTHGNDSKTHSSNDSNIISSSDDSDVNDSVLLDRHSSLIGANCFRLSRELAEIVVDRLGANTCSIGDSFIVLNRR